MNYYQILEITPQADAEEIKKAYKKLAKKYHPDTHPGNQEAERRFKQIVEAHGVLSHTNKRKEYDAKLYQKKTPKFDTESMKMNEMEKFFGFSFQEEPIKANKKATSKNPIDTTKMFEEFMKLD